MRCSKKNIVFWLEKKRIREFKQLVQGHRIMVNLDMDLLSQYWVFFPFELENLDGWRHWRGHLIQESRGDIKASGVSHRLGQFSSVQFSRVQLFVTPWTAARQASLSITNSWSLLKLRSIESRCHPTISRILCHLLLLPSVFPSIRVFSSGSVLRIRWPKYWSFSFSISPSNEYSGLISFRMDWLDLLEVQGTLKSLLQQHRSNASILWHSAFFIVQLSHPYMTTGKAIALTRWTFVGKVMSLLFNMLSRLVITFLPKEQVSFNFMTVVTICSDFGAPQNKVTHCFPIYLPWSDGTGCHDLSFLNVVLSQQE